LRYGVDAAIHTTLVSARTREEGKEDARETVISDYLEAEEETDAEEEGHAGTEVEAGVVVIEMPFFQEDLW